MDADTIATVMHNVTDHIESNRMQHDALYRLIINRNTQERRDFVAGIRTYLNNKYRHARENARDPFFRDQMDMLFDHASGTDTVANMLQVYIIHMAIFMEKRIAAYFCPPAPDPASDEPDMAIVDRIAFTMYQQTILLEYAQDLFNGTSLTVPTFCRDINAMYAMLLPSDPILEERASSGRKNTRKCNLTVFPEYDEGTMKRPK